jgi:type IX secretion system substrate protein
MLDISPVPVKRYTMIKWSSTTNSKLTITMFDVNGRFVLCRQYQLRKGANELLLTNLEALPAGVYFIKASDGASYRNGKIRIQQ